MKGRSIRAILLVGVYIFLNALVYADSVTVTLIPGTGDLTAPAGATVGWGYSITNDSSRWLVTNLLNADPFFNGIPNSVLFDYPVLDPGTSVTVAYDPLNSRGLYEFTWDMSAPPGFTNSGMFVFSFAWWDAGPFDGNEEVLSDISVAYSVTVAPTAAVPEPATLSLLGVGLAVTCLLGRRNSRQRAP